MDTEDHEDASITLDEVTFEQTPSAAQTPSAGNVPQDRPAQDQVAERPSSKGLGSALAGFGESLADRTSPARSDSEELEVDSHASTTNSLRSAVEWLAVVVVAISAALFIKEFAFQAFEIPSGSMEPTVVPGDRILVNKLSYRLGDVTRGDLVVFDRLEGTPGDTDQLIKRAIGLPGETVQLRADGELWIWGPEEGAAGAFMLDEPYINPLGGPTRIPTDATPITADIWHENCTNQPRTPGLCTLDDNSFFMLGDNRNSSVDSRFFGPIPSENVVGRAFVRIWPLGSLGGL